MGDDRAMRKPYPSDVSDDVGRDAEVAAALALVGAFLDAERRQRRIPGLSVAVVDDQTLLWTNAYGYADVERRRAATSRTVYRMASISKIFTAAALLHLRDAGRFHLDEPLERYLPEIVVRSPFSDRSPITFRQVAAHLAGLPRDWPHDADGTTEGGEARDRRMLELIEPPLTKRHYSNLGFDLLELALGQIAGQPAEAYITAEILAPLGMRRSGYGTIGVLEDVASPYRIGPADGVQPAPAPRTADGLFSTAEDLARFISLQFPDGPAAGARILKGSTLRELRAPVWVDDD